jgi:ankyrin repeat protein
MNRIDQELFDATGEDNFPEVRRLLSIGADVNAKDSRDRTPLHWASNNGHSQVVIELLNHGADVDAKNSRDLTPLHDACYNGHVAVVTELLSRGADVEAKTDDCDTPLHWASDRGHFAIVKALLSGGANILAANNYGKRPIDYAVSEGKSEVSKYLLQMFYATIRRLPLHKLLQDLTWIGEPNSRGAPPLRAAVHQHVLGTNEVAEILEFLVDRDPTLLRSRDQDGSVPLHVACRRSTPFMIVQSLVNRYKASVKSVTPQGDLPLFLACEHPKPSLDTIFLLMQLYPDLVYR